MTSRIIGPGNRVEALALLDEPADAQFPCMDAVCAGNGNGFGSGSGYYSATGNFNVFAGVVGTGPLANTVTFNFPFDPPGSAQTRTFRFTNIRLDPSSVASSTLQLKAITVVSQIPVTSIGGPLTVATSQTGLSANVRNASGVDPAPVGVNVTLAAAGQTTPTRAATLRFSPTYLGATLPRTIAAPVSIDQPGAPVDQNNPSSVYNSESGFYNSAFPVTNFGANLAQAGLAEWGTRLTATFSNLPPNVTIYVSLRSDNTAIFNASAARLISTDANGAGVFTPVAEAGPLPPSRPAAAARWRSGRCSVTHLACPITSISESGSRTPPESSPRPARSR